MSAGAPSTHICSMTTLKPLTDEETLHFQAWRATALQSMPYFASILFSFRPVATTAVDTFAIDPGHRVYINFENCIPKGAAFCAEGLLHEAGHLLGEHSMLAELTAVQDHERKAWNVAGDFAINDDLRDAGCSLLAAHGVFAAQIGEPDFQTPLYYMDKLRRRMGKPDPKQGQPGAQGSGQNGQNGDGTEGPLKGCGTGAGGEGGGFELDQEDDFNGQSRGASPVERELIRIRVAAAVKEHQNQNGRGSVPGGIVTMLEETLAPSNTPWERHLAAFMRRCVTWKAGHLEETHARRNRRRMNEVMKNSRGSVIGRVIAPGYIKPVPSVHFYRDTSGSVRMRDLAVATSEVTAISKRLGITGDELIVTDVDSRVHHSKRYTGTNSVAEVQGRGGTDMRLAIEHACALRKRPTCIVVATDGATPWPPVRPLVPVIVLLVNASAKDRKAVPEWALTVEVGDRS